MLRNILGAVKNSSPGLSFRGVISRQFCSPVIEPNVAIQASRLRRAMLYCPGNDQRKIDKIKSIAGDVDSIVLDCEDGVAINKKEEARATILKTLNELSAIKDTSLFDRYSVRINSMQSGLAEDDLRVILSGDVLPRTIYLPKVDTKVDLDHFVDSLQQELAKKEKARKDREKKEKKENKEKGIEKKTDKQEVIDEEPIDLVIFVESARGLLDLREICQHAIEVSEYTRIRLAGIVFGSDDFCANIGATRTDNGREVLLARQQVILVAKAYDLQAIDTVFIDFKNLDGLKQQSEDGAAMGFTGKQAIHPGQIQVIQEAFRPSDDRILWAKGLVDGFEAAQSEGKGAFVYKGQMIDMPLLKQAYNVLNIAKAIGKA